ncbi:hypothetical protein Vadar_001942 [Vaccinium darrowii]|uniref:Uncharacterized protein n=1 Tax=Vaccinium darrowii TaxID=229202 RepID=A0ACB7X7D4_9ERIC|nr:hypothetical protein Vadar_001942 [Vaccinium darrowii]
MNMIILVYLNFAIIVTEKRSGAASASVFVICTLFLLLQLCLRAEREAVKKIRNCLAVLSFDLVEVLSFVSGLYKARTHNWYSAEEKEEPFSLSTTRRYEDDPMSVATNLDEFQDVSQKLFSNENRTEASLGKKLKNDMLHSFCIINVVVPIYTYLLLRLLHPFLIESLSPRLLVDLVTETNKACEDLIFNHLKQHFPSHKFIAEETTAACGITEQTDEPSWIVDPLDGTKLCMGSHLFVFIIVLTIGKIPMVSTVYNPIMDEGCIADIPQGIIMTSDCVCSQTCNVK